MSPNDRRLGDLVVVDASLDDYALLLRDERLHELACRQTTTGHEALRSFDAAATALWMINVRLPDMTGVSLLEIMRRRARRLPIFLVGDRYDEADELAARVAGASAYLCKPADAAWLRLCRNAISRSAVRSGLPHSLG